jgi:dienelactone hydrolase
MRRWHLALAVLCCAAVAARAEVVTRPVEYRHGDTVLEGCLAHDNATAAKRPGILLAHQDGGNSTLARQRAGQWARFGYVVFAIDLYGKGVRPKDAKEAAAKAGLASKDRKRLRSRAEAGLNVLRKQPQVNPEKLAAIGYGVGGTAVLELARGGAELEGVICVHGDLSTPTPEDGKRISASVLALLGTDDPLIPLDQVTAFEEEMRSGGVDWQVIRYGGVAHDFTNPQAGRDLARGSAYDATADRRAAAAIQLFLTEAFPADKPVTTNAKPGPKEKPAAKDEIALPPGVPAKVAKVLQHVEDEGRPLAGYEGGRTFLNIERLLPQQDAKGRRIKYREWDVNPLRPGVNRGAERLVTGSDGSAYYTSDHYRSFKKIR